MTLYSEVDIEEKPAIHPNRISAIGGGLSLCSLVALSFDSTKLSAPIIYGFGAICDGIDGKVAREYDIRTVEGAKLDPLMDKIKNVSVGSYMIAQNVTDVSLVLSNTLNFIVDYVSQNKRGNIIDQFGEAYHAVLSPDNCNKDDGSSKSCANIYGKAKTCIQNIVHGLYISSVAYMNIVSDFFGVDSADVSDYVNTSCSALLFLSAGLGALGVYKKIKNS